MHAATSAEERQGGDGGEPRTSRNSVTARPKATRVFAFGKRR